ncbi:SSURE domain-containing protein [Lactococcus lactis]|uniref:SSURE domain-containing protein n=1 Tax=Lactococcus lactis TaxID=1358 RepID=UPI001F534C5E|nr:fibronectin-binding SSURE repeat-containing protein [Lactococcus lactis]MCI1072445.1 fibronectin-binding SSURE repeat-containing protein [Lactococcus lactis]
MQTKNTNFRTWKSGKIWLYSTSLLALLVIGGGLTSGTKVSADEVSAPQSTKIIQNAQSTEAADITNSNSPLTASIATPQNSLSSENPATPTTTVTKNSISSKDPSTPTSTVTKSSTSSENSAIAENSSLAPVSSAVATPAVTTNTTNTTNIPKTSVPTTVAVTSSISTSQIAPISEVSDGVSNNIKTNTRVSASELANAKAPGPFTAGVNSVIPLEAFGGDGMLTRLLLNSSNGAPWSDNGTAKNPALMVIDGLATGQYFYEVDLAGTNGLTGQNLLNYLRMAGTKSYQATVKIYAADNNDKANTSMTVATKMININITGLTENIKPSTTVSASELANAKAPGPFTAGVNSVIPLEAFGGDGMLTRLLLNSSNGAPWSDNGIAKNPALMVIDGLATGQYFYEVDLAGTNGLTGQDLLNYLRMTGTKSYQATVKIYSSNEDGTPNLKQVIASKTIMVDFTGEMMNNSSNETISSNSKPSSMSSNSTISPGMPSAIEVSMKNNSTPASNTPKLVMSSITPMPLAVPSASGRLPVTGDDKQATAVFTLAGIASLAIAGAFVTHRSRKFKNLSNDK